MYKIRWILGFAFIISVVGFSGFYYYRNQNSTSSQNTQAVSSKSSENFESSSQKSSIELFEVDSFAIQLARELKAFSGIQMGFIYSKNIQELEQPMPIKITNKTSKITKSELESFNYNLNTKSLGEVYKGEVYGQKNLLEFKKFNIKVPIIHSQLSDFFQINSDGFVQIAKPIIENEEEINKGNYKSVPIQNLLTKGVVRLAFSPLPGEVGNSYIIGHSSNFRSVKSEYNFVFAPLVEQSPIGEIFTIYDHKGRKLDFKVFEAISVKEEDSTTAYKNYLDKRVVTLQGSILETVNGKLKPTKRWLIRGELIPN